MPDVEGLDGTTRGPARSRRRGWRSYRGGSRTPTSRPGPSITQDPQPGDRIERGNFVTIVVSTGPKKVEVPNVVGRSRDEAVSALTSAGLTPNVVPVNSLEPVNTVLATAPKAGTEVIEGTSVRVNVSSGPKPVTVPNVIGSPFESAESTLQGVGFAVARENVEDAAAAGIVVGQSPAAGTQQGKGSVITLQVSQGPQTSQIPDVTSQTEADALAQLRASGFEVSGGRGDRRRREPRREGALAGSGGRHGRGGGHDGDDRRRPLRGSATARATAAADHDHSDHDHSLAVSRIRVAVVAGGRSSEHEISLASARSVLEALDPARYEVTQIAIGRDGRWALGGGDEPAALEESVPVTQSLPVLADSKPAEALAAVESSSRCCTAPSARTERCRGCSSWPTSPTSAPAWPLRRLHGQGPLQVGAARQRHPRQRNMTLRRGDERGAVRLPVFVKPARLGSSVGI